MYRQQTSKFQINDFISGYAITQKLSKEDDVFFEMQLSAFVILRKNSIIESWDKTEQDRNGFAERFWLLKFDLLTWSWPFL